MHNNWTLELAQLNGKAVISNVISYNCAFPAIISQNISCEKGLSDSMWYQKAFKSLRFNLVKVRPV